MYCRHSKKCGKWQHVLFCSLRIIYHFVSYDRVEIEVGEFIAIEHIERYIVRNGLIRLLHLLVRSFRIDTNKLSFNDADV